MKIKFMNIFRIYFARFLLFVKELPVKIIIGQFFSKALLVKQNDFKNLSEHVHNFKDALNF